MMVRHGLDMSKLQKEKILTFSQMRANMIIEKECYR